MSTVMWPYGAGGIGYEDGWTGAFTRSQADGAIPNGTPVQKVKTEDGDSHQIGAYGIVLGSIQAPGRPELMYFIEWMGQPKVASATIDWKVAPVKQ